MRACCVGMKHAEGKSAGRAGVARAFLALEQITDSEIRE
jgi:hypothetical protein